MRIDVQFGPAGVSWAELRDATRRAEDAGYAAAWVFDHLAASTFDKAGLMPECSTLLGALAVATTTIGLGTLVANVANRHPAVLARSLATARWVAGERVIAGLGAGAAPGTRWAAEHTELGIPLLPDAADRHRAVAEQIAALRAAAPGMAVIVGVNSVALATLAGELADGVNVRADGVRAAEFVAAAREARNARDTRDSPRSPGRPFEVSAYATGSVADHLGRCSAIGAERLILLRSVTDTLDDPARAHGAAR